ncbi:MAG: DNA polymerase Y family protein [Kiloniellales bacterium]|nr:DNA polymerase Y family protein [Kiloniellales bacterium]
MPRFATDRLARPDPRSKVEQRPAGPARPRVLLRQERGCLLLAAVDARAAAAGLAPGMPLADARAILPELETAAHDPAADLRALSALAAWCGRFTPWVAPDRSACDGGGAAGLLLDVTGCAHLFGGEAALLGALVEGLERQGFAARAALAGTPGLAWAVARFAPPGGAGPDTEGGTAGRVVAPDAARATLAELPVAALRLTPGQVELLERLGLRRVGDLYDLPAGSLARRFGPMVAHRLAQALGRVKEAISPLTPVPPFVERLALPEPSDAPEAIVLGLETLILALCRRLEERGRGARRLVFTLYRADGSLGHLKLGTSRPSREPQHLQRLFAQRLEQVDPGFGVEVMTLAATAAEPLTALQSVLPCAAAVSAREAATPASPAFAAEAGPARALAAPPPRKAPPEALPAEALGEVVDRLVNRLGATGVTRREPRESHIPERAAAAVAPMEAAAAASAAAWQRPQRPRPLRLLPRAQPIEAMALLPDHPPARFRWRRLLHRVAAAEGPERLSPEWWHAEPVKAAEPQRDYFRVEDDDGRRYWVYRAEGRWYLHGLFA